MTNLESSSGSGNEQASPKSSQGDVNLSNSHFASVHGENVHINEASVGEVTGNLVELHDALVHVVDGTTINAQDAFIGQAHTEALNISEGGVGVAYAQNATIHGDVGAMTVDSATLNDSHVGVMVSREVHGDQIHSSVLLAGSVTGNVETTFDARNALIFGAAFGLALGITIGLLGRFISSKK